MKKLIAMLVKNEFEAINDTTFKGMDESDLNELNVVLTDVVNSIREGITTKRNSLNNELNERRIQLLIETGMDEATARSMIEGVGKTVQKVKTSRNAFNASYDGVSFFVNPDGAGRMSSDAKNALVKWMGIKYPNFEEATHEMKAEFRKEVISD